MTTNRANSISIVSTMYKSSTYIPEFVKRITTIIEKFADFEIILVDDGSPDNSLQQAIELAKTTDKVRVVELSRNFGHHRAIMAGLAEARHDLIFLIDIDLEEMPEWLDLFYEKMLATSCDVVFGVQVRRKGKIFERWSGALFYKLINLVSDKKIAENLCTARLMSRPYVNALLCHEERELFLAGILASTGFRQEPCAVVKSSRGKSSYSLAGRIALLVNAVTSMSSAPLVFVFYLGSSIMLLSTAAAAGLIISRLLFAILLPGWASLIVSIWFLGGLTIFCIGLVGVYLSKVFIEVKSRPRTIVRSIHTNEGRS